MASRPDTELTRAAHLVMAGPWTAAQLGAMQDALRPLMAAQGLTMAPGMAGPSEKSAARAYRQFACVVANPMGEREVGAGEDVTALEVSARIMLNLRAAGAGALRCNLQFLARRSGAAARSQGEGPFLFGRALSFPLEESLLRQNRIKEALEAGVAGCLGEDPQAALAALARDFVQELAEQMAP